VDARPHTLPTCLMLSCPCTEAGRAHHRAHSGHRCPRKCSGLGRGSCWGHCSSAGRQEGGQTAGGPAFDRGLCYASSGCSGGGGSDGMTRWHECQCRGCMDSRGARMWPAQVAAQPGISSIPAHRALCLGSAVAGGVGLADLAAAGAQACIDATGGVAFGEGDCALVVGRSGCAGDIVDIRHVSGTAGVGRAHTAALAVEGGGGAAVDKVCRAGGQGRAA
jgi:hypothetical protein